MKQKFLLSALILTASTSFAAESLSTKVHNQYQSLRAMGMGNAFTTISDDYTALMYNPATLAKKKRGEIQFTLAGAGVAMDTMKMMTDISDAEKGAVTDSDKIIAISNVLDKYYGKQLGGRIQAAEIFWVRPSWGFAILPVDLSFDLSVNKQFGPALDINLIKDTTVAFGYGQEIMPNIYAGATVKGIHRNTVAQTVPVAELANNSNVFSKDRFKEGMNFDADIGFLWTPEFGTSKAIKKEIEKPADDMNVEVKAKTPESAEPASADATRTVQSETASDDTTPAVAADAAATKENPTPLPEAVKKEAEKAEKTETPASEKTEVAAEQESGSYQPLAVSAVIRNLISSSYSKSTMINKDATEAPDKNSRVIDLGVGYEILSMGDLKIRATAEAKNLMHPNTTTRKSSHAGFEFDYSPGTWFETQFRVGMNQMYYTAGLTLLLGVVEIDAVTYGEEVGTSSTNIENRVYAAKVGFNF